VHANAVREIWGVEILDSFISLDDLA
jgi:hypothetical protein